MEPGPLRIVVNPSAGREGDDSTRAELAELLPEAEVLDAGDDLIARLESCAEGPVIGIVGGDGSINAAASVAIECGRPLAVFPGGTLNHFARDAGLASAADTVAALRDNSTRRVDVGRIDGRAFLNTASLGSYPEMVDERERIAAGLRLFGNIVAKWAAMVVATVVVMRRSTPMELTIDGERARTWAIFIGNCEYEPAGLAPLSRRRLDDGVFDVRWIDAAHRWSRTRVALALLAGRFGRSVALERRVVDRLVIRSHDGPVRLARDGETFDGGVDVVVEKDANGLDVYLPG